jgi:hypothetical protein
VLSSFSQHFPSETNLQAFSPRMKYKLRILPSRCSRRLIARLPLLCPRALKTNRVTTASVSHQIADRHPTGVLSILTAECKAQVFNRSVRLVRCLYHNKGQQWECTMLQ